MIIIINKESPAGLEPATFRLTAERSDQLSYGDVRLEGIEPSPMGLQSIVLPLYYSLCDKLGFTPRLSYCYFTNNDVLLKLHYLSRGKTRNRTQSTWLQTKGAKPLHYIPCQQTESDRCSVLMRHMFYH